MVRFTERQDIFLKFNQNSDNFCKMGIVWAMFLEHAKENGQISDLYGSKMCVVLAQTWD